MQKRIIEEILNRFNQRSIDFDVYIIANAQEKTNHIGPSEVKHAYEDEFFSRIEFAEIASALFDTFGYCKVFFSEIEFINYILNNSIRREECIVYNLSRDGQKEGKKSLIPAICDLFGLRYTGSNAFVISLLRNKYICGKVLSAENIPIPQSYVFNTSNGFISGTPVNNQRIIVKHINESASLNLTNDNVFVFKNDNDSFELLQKLCKKMSVSNILVQEYIPGKECEVLVLREKNKFMALDPIEIIIHDEEFMTSDISNDYRYSFRPLCKSENISICNTIRSISEKAARILNISTYARFDFRVNDDGNCYLIDIAGTPYTIKHSSISYLFQKVYGFDYKDIYKVIIQLTCDG